MARTSGGYRKEIVSWEQKQDEVYLQELEKFSFVDYPEGHYIITRGVKKPKLDGNDISCNIAPCLSYIRKRNMENFKDPDIIEAPGGGYRFASLIDPNEVYKPLTFKERTYEPIDADKQHEMETFLERYYRSLPEWKGSVLDKLPPLQWGRKQTPTIRQEFKHSRPIIPILSDVKLEHPFMDNGFRAKIVIVDNNRIYLKGIELAQAGGGIERTIPLSELSYNGIALADLVAGVDLFSGQTMNSTYDGSERNKADNTNDVYHHRTLGFVVLVRHDILSGKSIVRQLVPDERQLVSQKFDIDWDIFGEEDEDELMYKKANPEDVPVNTVEPSELVKFHNFRDLGVQDETRYAIVRESSDYVHQEEEFFLIIENQPLAPKLDKAKLVPIRGTDGNLIYIEKDGIKQPALTNPQITRKVKYFDRQLGKLITRDVPVYESPRVLCIGETTGCIKLFPASWLYRIDSQDNKVISKTMVYDRNKRRVIYNNIEFPEIPTVRAWEDRNDRDHCSFTLLRTAKGLGKPDPGSYSTLPGREKWINTERYKWDNPANKTQVIGEEMPVSGFEDYIDYSTSISEEIMIDVGVTAIIEPGHEEIMIAVNKEAWYWQQEPVSPKSLGFSNLRIQWTNKGDLVATVHGILGDRQISIPVMLAEPGRLTTSQELTKAQAGFICRLISYHAAKVRLMARLA